MFFFSTLVLIVSNFIVVCALSRVIKILLTYLLIILVFLTPYADTQFQGESRQRRRKIHGSGKFVRFLTEITIYLGNGIIQDALIIRSHR